MQFAHALVNSNAFICKAVIAVCAALDLFQFHRHRGNLFQYAPKILVLLNAAGQCIYRKIGDLFAVGLAHIKDAYHLKGRDLDFLLLHDGLTVSTDHRLPGIRVDLFRFFLYGVRCRGKDFYAFFSALYMTLKVIAPLAKACNKGGVRLLHQNQQRIVQTVIMELGHGFQIGLIAFTFKQLPHTGFQPFRHFLYFALGVLGSQLKGSCFKITHAFAPFKKIGVGTIPKGQIPADLHGEKRGFVGSVATLPMLAA